MTERKLVHERWALSEDATQYGFLWDERRAMTTREFHAESARIDAWHRTFNAALAGALTSPAAHAHHAHGPIPRLRVYTDGSVEIVPT